ncbi:MAG: tRNA 2-selenouridine(34) synthase MnmH [Tindallia sp. MSAO_Bac2]|nr:MAG: tRNA 2-selenouridine(34) synthase MnmH [Tindallia sp. MSAO_Bac2]
MYTVNIDEVINDSSCLFVDLRSPAEFEKGTIHNAVNLPILDNEERELIGTIYKQKSASEAKLVGIDKVSPKLDMMLNKIIDYKSRYKKIVLFCSRGGYRSGPLVHLCNHMKIKVFQLKGGYKSYRKYTLNYFDNIHTFHKFIVLHGYTGVGKTIMLDKLENEGFPCINLEEMAHNSGSVFGFIGQPIEKTTQKQFESLLLDKMIKNKSIYFFIESESQRIGGITIPTAIYNQMVKGFHVLIDTSHSNRVDNLIKEYADEMSKKNDDLIKALNDLKQILGTDKIQKYKRKLLEGDYKSIVQELTINYYDPLYRHSLKKYSYDLNITYDTIEEALEQLRQFYKTKEGYLINE